MSLGRIFPPIEHRIFPSYWQPPIVETQYITDSIRKDLVKPNFIVERQMITDSIRKDLVKPNFVVESQAITDSGSYILVGSPITLLPIADTYLAEGENVNKNSENVLKVKVSDVTGNKDNRFRPILKFDLSPYMGYTVFSAQLKIYNYQTWSEASPTTIQWACYRLTSDWSETDATWYHRTATAYWNNYGGDYTTIDGNVQYGPAQGSWITFDVKNIVQGWLNNSYPNYGFIYKSYNETESAFNEWWSYSRERTDVDAQYRPRLILQFIKKSGSI